MAPMSLGAIGGAQRKKNAVFSLIFAKNMSYIS
jgi:hypothetical protein